MTTETYVLDLPCEDVWGTRASQSIHGNTDGFRSDHVYGHFCCAMGFLLGMIFL